MPKNKNTRELRPLNPLELKALSTSLSSLTRSWENNNDNKFTIDDAEYVKKFKTFLHTGIVDNEGDDDIKFIITPKKCGYERHTIENHVTEDLTFGDYRTAYFNIINNCDSFTTEDRNKFVDWIKSQKDNNRIPNENQIPNNHQMQLDNQLISEEVASRWCMRTLYFGLVVTATFVIAATTVSPSNSQLSSALGMTGVVGALMATCAVCTYHVVPLINNLHVRFGNYNQNQMVNEPHLQVNQEQNEIPIEMNVDELYLQVNQEQNEGDIEMVENQIQINEGQNQNQPNKSPVISRSGSNSSLKSDNQVNDRNI